MKKILFDLLSAQPTGNTKYHGGGEYIKTVFQKLCSEFSDKCELSVFYDESKFIDEWIVHYIKNYKIKKYNIKEISELKIVFESNQFDVFYSGLPYLYNKNLFPENVIVKGTVHSLRNVEMPVDRYTYIYQKGLQSFKSFVKYWLWTLTKYDARRNCLKANREYLECLTDFICDSQYSKFSILQSYPNLEEHKIQVYYAPSKFETDSITATSCEDNYILIISGNRWEKNSFRAILAIDQLITDGLLNNYIVKVVGDPGIKIKKRIKHIDSFMFFNYLSTEDLNKLYSNCSIFLYPTLNEGFGMPPIEAMRFGKTCILSSVCSLPEVYGDSVYWTNPYDIYEIKNRIMQAVHNRISQEKVKVKCDAILAKQKIDLIRICTFIIE